MAKPLIERIQNWYKNNCNGEWEHDFGIKIETMDNPGWSVIIDLEDTSLEKAKFKIQSEIAEDNWLIVRIEDKKFSAFGDPSKLNEILRIFLDDIIPFQSDPEVLYEIFVPVQKSKIPLWRSVEAKLINEQTFEIVAIPEPDLKVTQVLDFDDYPKLDDTINLNDIDFKQGDKVTCELKLFADSKGLVVSKKI